MPNVNITIFSKNKIALQNFLVFLQNRLPSLRLKMTSKFKNKKEHYKKITILKSTHINKTAQEKYEYKLRNINLKTNSFKIKKYLLVFKKLKNNLFPDIKIKIETTVKNKKFNTEINYLTLRNYNLNLNKIQNIQKWETRKYKKKNNLNSFSLFSNSTKKTLNYLKINDYFGELEINRNYSLDSSVGRA